MMGAIYFLGIVDNLRSALFVVATLSFFAVIVLRCEVGFSYDMDNLPRVNATKRWLSRVIVIGCIAAVLNCIVPNSKTLAAMYIVPAIVNNEQIQGIAGNSLKALEKLTQKWLKDLAEEAEHI